MWGSRRQRGGSGRSRGAMGESWGSQVPPLTGSGIRSGAWRRRGDSGCWHQDGWWWSAPRDTATRWGWCCRYPKPPQTPLHAGAHPSDTPKPRKDPLQPRGGQIMSLGGLPERDLWCQQGCQIVILEGCQKVIYERQWGCQIVIPGGLPESDLFRSMSSAKS